MTVSVKLIHIGLVTIDSKEIYPEGITMLAHPHPTPKVALPLAEIALNAAIELDGNLIGARKSEWLTKLADALASDASRDVGLFPIYDRALTSSEGMKAASKSDLYAKLGEMSRRLNSVDDSSENDTLLLRDFCVALHDALLNQGYLSHQKTVSNSRPNA